MANDRFFECPICGREIDYHHMERYGDISWAVADDNGDPQIVGEFTRDCHGIPFRLVCSDCYDKVMDKGYDGEYYTEFDECIEPDY